MLAISRAVEVVCDRHPRKPHAIDPDPGRGRKTFVPVLHSQRQRRAVESFWSTVKHELVYRRAYATRAQARQAIFDYIETFYNRQHLHSKLDYMSPALN